MMSISFKKIRLFFLVSIFFIALLLAYEVYFIVTNSNRDDSNFPGQDSPPQDTSSGLFSGYVGADSDYEKMKAKGAVMIDFDRDNDLDLYYGYAQSHFFENENGFFTEMTDAYNIESSGSTGLVAGDMDNNGFVDILKWRFTPSTSTSLEDTYDTEFDNSPHFILMNQGNNEFNTKEYLPSHLIPFIHSQGFMDADLDGDLDIVVIEDKFFNQFHLFLNDGFDSFGRPILTNAFIQSRLDTSSSRTLAIIDYDNDGDQDVYIPRKFGINWLLENQTLEKVGNEIVYNPNPNPFFVEVAIDKGVDDFDASPSGSTGYGAAWGDFDNDNNFDLYLSNWGDNILYKNNENGSFLDMSSEIDLRSDSLSNGSGWGDFNNDGYIDIWAANIKREDDVYLNSGNSNWELWDFGYDYFFQAATQDIIPADYNNDGWLDVFAAGLRMIGGPNGPKYTSLLYKNTSLEDGSSLHNHWLKLDLEGAMLGINNDGWSELSNRSAVGARVIVHLPDKNISREIIAGKGHGSMDPLQLHFGLGLWSTIDSITVSWPSRDIITNQPKRIVYQGPIQSDKRYTIFENINIPFETTKGDTTEDSVVNILDVSATINFFFDDLFFTDIQYWAADMNSDHEINVIDIVFLVNFILSH
ncbi:FG-GAP-like repeat-containing protein [bacterium]|nr:FG-GAP-like repeat-containing protein [bacterium]